jgi:hypothetical protein
LSLFFFTWLWTIGQKKHHLSVTCVETWVYSYDPKTIITVENIITTTTQDNMPRSVEDKSDAYRFF